MTQLTIVGNLTEAPELRYTASGKAVAGFTVAVSKRIKDGDGWKDGPASFYRCSIWDQAAENMTESLSKGQRVIVVGEIAQRSFETNSGEKRSVFEVTASEVGPSLRWATAKVEKTGGNTARRHTGAKTAAPDDPWNAAPAVGGDDAPPF